MQVWLKQDLVWLLSEGVMVEDWVLADGWVVRQQQAGEPRINTPEANKSTRWSTQVLILNILQKDHLIQCNNPNNTVTILFVYSHVVLQEFFLAH